MSSSSPSNPSSDRSQPTIDPALPTTIDPANAGDNANANGTEGRPRRGRPRHDFPESQAGKMWRALSNPAGGPVNEMPGGTYNTAGGKPREASWRDALRFDMFSKKEGRPSWYQTSCARDSLLVGIGAGGAVGGVNFILRGVKGLVKAGHWTVGAFSVTALGLYTWCDRRRQEEAKGIAAAVTGMKLLHDKKTREEAERKRAVAEEARKRREEEEERRRNKSWYKWW